MHSVKRRPVSKRQQQVVELLPDSAAFDDGDAEEFDDHDTEVYRVICPECAQPIALLPDDEVLPQHARCASPWNPFGATVCSGTGRKASDARPASETFTPQEEKTAVVLTLPQGLDWRMQPFSHVGGPGTRPMRVPVPTLRRRAA